MLGNVARRIGGAVLASAASGLGKKGLALEASSRAVKSGFGGALVSKSDYSGLAVGHVFKRYLSEKHQHDGCCGGHHHHHHHHHEESCGHHNHKHNSCGGHHHHHEGDCGHHNHNHEHQHHHHLEGGCGHHHDHHHHHHHEGQADQFNINIKSEEPAYFIVFTCKKCETRQGHRFSKVSYHQGVVIARCPGCKKLHLLADNLKWFSSEKRTAEDIARAIGENFITLTHEHLIMNSDAGIPAETLVHDKKYTEQSTSEEDTDGKAKSETEQAKEYATATKEHK